MDKAYIILAHNKPEQLYRLMDILDDDLSCFFVHIDKKVSLNEFARIFELDEKMILVERVVTNWAGYGLVQATLNALYAIKESGINFNQIILLSGQDYPVKHNRYLDEFFKSARHNVFIEYFRMPNYHRWQPNGGMFRINKYFFGLKRHERLAAKTLNFLSAYFSFLQRKSPEDIVPYAGSQWWMMNMYAVEYILNFIESNPRYASFHRFTFAADEVFFHSILLNAKDEILRESIVNDNKRYMNWPDTSKGHPEILIKKDFESLAKTKALFARKFDASVDEEILNLIDDYCLNKQDSSNYEYA